MVLVSIPKLSKFISVFVILIVISFHVNSQGTGASHNVGDFLNKLMRDYQPKHTRHYTLLNGNPVYSGADPPSSRDISKTLLTPSNHPLLNSLVPEGSSPFMNFGPWNPTPNANPPSNSPSFFSSFFGRSVGAESIDETMKAQEKSEIITIDDLKPNEPEVHEFKIESSMSF